MTAIFKRMDVYLVPANEEAEAMRNRVPNYGLAEMKLTAPKQQRSLEWHRLYWAAVGMMYENLPERFLFPTKENFEEEVRIAAGHRDVRHRLDGRPYYVARPINFASMDRDGWREYWQMFSAFVAKNVLPGIEYGELWERINEMTE